MDNEVRSVQVKSDTELAAQMWANFMKEYKYHESKKNKDNREKVLRSL